MPHSLKPPMAKLQTRQGAQSRDRLDVLHLWFIIRNTDVALDIDTTSDMGHITAVLVLVPKEWQGGHLIVLPRVNRFDRCPTPIKGFVRCVIGGPIYKHDEFFILGPDEAFPNTVPNEITKWVVIREDVDEDDSYWSFIHEDGEIARVVKKRCEMSAIDGRNIKARLTFIMDIKLVPGDDF